MSNQQLENESLRQYRILFYANIIAGLVLLVFAACAVVFWRPPEVDDSFLFQSLPRILPPLAGGGRAFFFRQAAKCPPGIVDLLERRRAHALEERNKSHFKAGGG